MGFYYGGNMMDGTFGYGGGWIMGILIIAVLAVLIYFVANNSTGNMQNQALDTTPKNETPLQIAAKRYAKGEITKEEYEEIKRTLGG